MAKPRVSEETFRDGAKSAVADMTADRKLIISALGLSGILISLYGIASFFPASFLWGVNHLAYLAPGARALLLIVGVLLMIPFCSTRYVSWAENLYGFVLSRSVLYAVISLGIGAGFAFCFYHWRISTDMYGDTRALLRMLSSRVYTLSDLLNPRETEPLTRMVHQTLANLLQTDIKSTFEIVSSVCGGVLISASLFFLHALKASPRWKILVLALIVTTGANQLFFGHVEDYTLVYLCAMLFFMTAWLWFEGKNVFPLLIGLFIVGVRLHVEMVLLLPALVYGILSQAKGGSLRAGSMLRGRSIVLAVAATLVFAAFAYVFYFNAYQLTGDGQEERAATIFMPIVNPLRPPHSYSLLSIKHLADVSQEFLLTVSPAVWIILALRLFFRRYVKRNEPRIMFYGLASFYVVLFNCTVNPLLGMIRDWDLLSFAAAPLTFLVIDLSRHLFSRLQGSSIQRIIVGACIAPSIFPCLIPYINANNDLSARRLENVGEWAYKSYYWGSSYLIDVGQAMIPNAGEQIARRQASIDRLLPLRSAPDPEIGFLYGRLGGAYYLNKNHELAVQNYGRALEANPKDREVRRLMTIPLMLLWKFDEAEKSIEAFNDSVNEPAVSDFRGLLMAQYTYYLKFLHARQVDTASIQKKLDGIFVRNQ